MGRPDATAVTAALWRAAHLIVDDAPHVFDDDLALEFVRDPEVLRSAGYPVDADATAPSRDNTWITHALMGAQFAPFRATIVGRARFVEDLVAVRATGGATQYVILGAGLDSFAWRRTDLSSRVVVFEVDEPGAQEWKRNRLEELGKPVPPYLRLVPVDFESGESWATAVTSIGFASNIPTVIASTGVTQYLSPEATVGTMRSASRLADECTFVCSFMVPIDHVGAAEREMRALTERRSASSGHPWVGVFSTDEFAALALDAGFSRVEIVSPGDLSQRYFRDRSDQLRPSESEHLLVAASGSPSKPEAC